MKHAMPFRRPAAPLPAMAAAGPCLPLLAACLLLALAWPGSVRAAWSLDAAAFSRHVASLTSAPHRLAGTPEGRAAGDYLLAELGKLGGRVFTQDFEFPMEAVEICELRTAAGVVPLQPFMANGILPCNLPGAGMQAELAHLHGGDPAALAAAVLQDRIAVVDVAAGIHLAELVRRGVRAVIFVGNPGAASKNFQDKISDVSISLPRFYISRGAAERHGLAAARSGTLHSRITWQLGRGRNIFLYLEGTKPVFSQGQPEYVILSANYDTFGFVPRNSVGAGGAANCAALLETARTLAAAPPERSVLCAFFDNHANFFQGARDFYTALRRGYAERLDDPLSVRLEFAAAEAVFLNGQQEFLARPEAFYSETGPTAREARRRAMAHAKYNYSEYQRRASASRIRIRELAARDAAAAAVLERELAEIILPRQKTWQQFLTSLINLRQEQGAGEAQAETIAACLENNRRRLAELEREKRYLEQAAELAGFLHDSVPVLHAGFSFGGEFDRWLVAPENTLRPALRKQWLEAVRQAAGQGAAAGNFVWQAAMGSAFTAHVAPRLGETIFTQPFLIPGVSLRTVEDLDRDYGAPGAPPAPEFLDNVRRQAEDFLGFLAVLTAADFFSCPNQISKNRGVPIEDYQWKDGQADGHRVMSIPYGDTSPSRPEPGALVLIRRTSGNEIQSTFRCFTDANGCFPLRILAEAHFRDVRITAGLFGAAGELTAISTYFPAGPRASVQSGWAKAGFHGLKSRFGYYTIVTLFRGPGGLVAGRNLPFSDSFNPKTFSLLNGLSNSTYKFVHFDLDEAMGIGAYWVEEPFGVKFIYQHPKEPEEVAFLINSIPKEVTGIGYGPGAGEAAPGAPYEPLLDLNMRMAPDLFALNEQRLRLLRGKNIIRNDLEVIHGQARELRTRLEVEAAAGNHAAALRTANLLSVLQQKIYRPIVAITNDMVVAVTILLLLALPFGFAIQSLVFPTYDVYRRIFRFILIFLGAFAILYFVHPAFSFASMPAVIIIAFVILILSGLVIYLIGAKFSYEVKKMQGLASAAHSFETSAVGNFGAAVSLAVSTMRRRPVRTGLTVVTVLLLTFTILSFASFQAEKGVNEFYLGAGDPASRLLIRRKVWKNMHPHNLEQFREHLRDGFEVHGRFWRTVDMARIARQEDAQVPVYSLAGNFVEAASIMTLDRLETERIPALAGLLAGDVEAFHRGEGIFLSPGTVAALGAAPGDTVRVAGANLKLLGTFDPRVIAEIRQIDDSPLLPIDFNLTQQALGHFEAKGSAYSVTASDDLLNELEALGNEALEPVAADAVVIAPTALAPALRLTLKAVVAYPRGEADMPAAARDLAMLNIAGVYLNNAGERNFLHFSDKAGIGGMSDIMIPLLLGGMIIFSTMLGSIIDREKEIYTFSALGLAPRSIAMLFFVESGIYAVIGGFGGYLLSQVCTKGLEILSAYGLFRAPELNYSSSTAIYTILLVMITVIVSTIYPAIQAAKKATADTTSAWRVPAPQGNVCAFDFPFTISRFDISGVICFLREHFAAFADRTIGAFAVDNIEVFVEGGHGMLGLRADIWLQPFDEGISQRFELTARPSDIPEVCEIHVRAERLSGPPGSWRRSNTLFMKDLRRQFLLWRTLDETVMEHYLAKADAAEEQLGMAAANPETAAPAAC